MKLKNLITYNNNPIEDTFKIKFSGGRLFILIWPLIIEQMLALTVGLADSLMVASVGEEAVSAVSLVDTINVLLINAFTALAAGGAVVAGQFIGRRDIPKARQASHQLLLFITALSLVITTILYFFRKPTLSLLFGTVDHGVMDYSLRYFNIVEASIPFLAIYNVGAALFRIMGNSKTSMKVSLLMNAINVAGNGFLIFVMKWSVEGVALPTLVSRGMAAVIMLSLLFSKKIQLHMPRPFNLRFNWGMIKNIIRIGIPNGIENSLFQLGKILLLSVVSAFGTASIAANAIGNTIAGLQIIPGMAIGVALVTVVSQCVGAQDFAAARFYTKKLLKITYISMLIFNITVFALLPLLLGLYNVSDDAAHMAKIILLMHGSMAILFWPMSFTLPQTLKAAGDTTFTMVVAAISMWIFRIFSGILLAKTFGYGVIGTWIAMFIDWICRILFFVVRYRGNKWESKYVR